MPSRFTRSAWIPVTALLAAVAVAATFQIRSTDFFWHLVTGRWILEHGAVPVRDPFRFTSDAVAGGVPWVDHEWLFQVLLALGERLGGIPALELARATVITGLAALLLASLRRAGTPLAAAVLVTLAAVLGARERFLLRPELASLAALVALLALLSELRRAPPEARGRRWALPAVLLALTIAWANLHPGALAAPVLAAAFLVGSRLPGGRGGDRGRAPIPWGVVLGVPVLLAAALLLNPSGSKLLTVPLEIGASLEELPGYNPEWQPAWAAPRPVFFFGLAALVLLAVLAWRRSRRLDPATGLTTLALLALGLASVRHQGLFFLGAAFFAGETLADLATASPNRLGAPPRLPARPLAALACLLVALGCLWPPSRGPLAPRRPYPFGLGLQPGRFPEAGVDALAAWPGLERPYHDGVYGGYLLWRLYPPRKIFIDGRNEVNPELLAEIGAARRDSRRWQALLDRHRIDSALVRYDDRPVPVLGAEPGEVHTLHALLFPREQFALVYFDDLVMLFVRRTAADAAELEAREYRRLHPEDWRAALAAAARDPGALTELAAELERRLGEAPPCRRALRLQAALAELTTGP